MSRPLVIFDTETYVNYSLVMFRGVESGKVISFESHNDSSHDRQRLVAFLKRYTVIGFNCEHYDNLILRGILSGYNNKLLKQLSDYIITNGARRWQTEREYELNDVCIDSVDLQEPAPGVFVSLKLYGGRLKTKKLQDLPFDPSSVIQNDQLELMRKYCINDLILTGELYQAVKHEVDLRERMSVEYGEDLRSKGGAQVATSVLTHMLMTEGITPMRPKIDSGYSFKYVMPPQIYFKSKALQEVYRLAKDAVFVVGDSGHVKLPKELNKAIDFEGAKYKLGIGGLHSQEKKQTVIAGDDYILAERDVASMYPNLILNERLYPEHLTSKFLDVYGGIVASRLKAKHENDKETSDSLKLVVNSSFGLFGSKYSILYSPDLLVQTTITGQLSLLMLIEQVTDIGATVVSANTDGVVIKCHRDLYEQLEDVCLNWEITTGLDLEETRYRALHSASVNNYAAITLDNKVKCKGAYGIKGLSKNPNCVISTKAVLDYLTDGVDIETTIMACTDPADFAVVRTVNGGAVDSFGNYIGKVIRWYYAKGVDGSFHYQTNGNRVPKSAGAKPMLDLPEKLPVDLDYSYYIALAYERLTDTGAKK